MTSDHVDYLIFCSRYQVRSTTGSKIRYEGRKKGRDPGMTNTFLWCICCFVASLSQQFLAVFVAFPGSVVPAAVMALQRQGARREGGMAGQRTVRTGTLQGQKAKPL